MDRRTLIVLGAVTALLCVSLVGTAILVGASGGSSVTSSYVVEQGTATGGGYHLTGLAWQFHGTASDGHYRLLEPAAPGGGNQCCCTYLPCVLRSP